MSARLSGPNYFWSDRFNPTFSPPLALPDYLPEYVESFSYIYDICMYPTVGVGHYGRERVVVVVKRLPKQQVVCAGPYHVYEGSDDIKFQCSVEDPREGSSYDYTWTSSKRRPHSKTALLSSTSIEDPTFDVPETVDADEIYEYTLDVRTTDLPLRTGTADVRVTVVKKHKIGVSCDNPDPVYEGSGTLKIQCRVRAVGTGGYGLTHAWTAVGDTPNTALLSPTSSTYIASPTFSVPDNVDETTIYEYRLTVSHNSHVYEEGSADVKVTVLDRDAPAITCEDPEDVYEGAADFPLDCSVTNEPAGATYSWTGTDVENRLTNTDSYTPTFSVPDDVGGSDKEYNYTVELSATGIDNVTEDVTVTVLNKNALAVTCADPGSVYEGSADITFDCEASGAPTIDYTWTGSTSNTALLSSTIVKDPTFYVPDEVSETTTYEYTLTVSADNAIDGSARVTVTVLNKEALAVTCARIRVQCMRVRRTSRSTARRRGRPPSTIPGRAVRRIRLLLSSTTVEDPTFYVPDEVAATTTYEYLLTVSADNAIDGSARVTVTVLNKEALAVTCADPGSVYEGSADITFDCEASGVPTIDYTWTGSTSNTALLSSTTVEDPTFYVPDEVAATTTYEYLLTVSAENAIDGSAEVTVTVLNTGALAVSCTDPAPSVYEGSEDITFDCTARGAPAGSTIEYAWTSSTSNTALLSSTTVEDPTFYVPDEVSATTTYEYRLTARAENAEDGSARVTVTVLNTGSLAVTCADPGSVYEGSADITFDCEASGAPTID